MVMVQVQLPKDVEAKARAAGLLTDEGIRTLIEAELERRREEAAERLTGMMDSLSAHMRDKYGDLTEEEAQEMLDRWLDEADSVATNEGGKTT